MQAFLSEPPVESGYCAPGGASSCLWCFWALPVCGVRQVGFINSLLPSPPSSPKKDWRIKETVTAPSKKYILELLPPVGTRKNFRLKCHPPEMKSKNPNGFTVKSILVKCWIIHFFEEKFNTLNKISGVDPTCLTFPCGGVKALPSEWGAISFGRYE